MADIAAQREARRRKLTQNAEARMNRLLGLSRTTEENEKSSFLTSNPRDEKSSFLTSNPRDEKSSFLTSNPRDEKRPLQTSNPDDDQSEEHQRSVSWQHSDSAIPKSPPSSVISSSFSPTSIRSRPSYREPEAAVTIKHHTEIRASTDGELESTKHTSTENAEVPADNIDCLPVLAQRFDARSLELLKIVVFILMAFLARFFLKFGIGLFIVQSIFVPFITLEIGLMYLIHKYLQHIPPSSSKGTIMSAVLMLCGIKHELMDTYHNIMSYVAAVTSDFCLYFFSFIIWSVCIA